MDPAVPTSPPARTRRRAVPLGVVASLIAVLVTGGVVLATRRDARDFRAARRALDEKRYADATGPIDRILRNHPRSAEGHFLRARLEFGTGNPERASGTLIRAADLGYDPVAVDRLRGFLLVLAGQYPAAEPLLVHAREATSGPDPELDEALARCYLQTYQLRAAEAMLRRWAEEAPDDPRPWLWMVDVDKRLDVGPTRVGSRYRQALLRDPNLDSARLGLAESLWATRRYDEAMKEYRTYIARHPSDPAGPFGAGRVALDQQKIDEAVAFFDKALALNPDHLGALKARAGIAMQRQQYAAALPLVERAARLDPLDTETLHRQGLALTRLGREDEAREVQEKANRLRDDLAELERLRHLVRREPRSNDVRARIVGWFLGHGQDEEGLRWARTILTTQPDHLPTNRLLADYYGRHDQPGLANYYRLQADQAARGR